MFSLRNLFPSRFNPVLLSRVCSIVVLASVKFQDFDGIGTVSLMFVELDTTCVALENWLNERLEALEPVELDTTCVALENWLNERLEALEPVELDDKLEGFCKEESLFSIANALAIG